jgi:hypothetical protein
LDVANHFTAGGAWIEHLPDKAFASQAQGERDGRCCLAVSEIRDRAGLKTPAQGSAGTMKMFPKPPSKSFTCRCFYTLLAPFIREQGAGAPQRVEA